MKRLFSLFLSFTFFISVFFVFPLPVDAAPCFDPGSLCTAPNKYCCSPVDGKRYNCLGNRSTGGSKLQGQPTCQEDPEIPLEITCKCQHSLDQQEVKIDGNNGFTCGGTNPKGQQVEKSTFCASHVNCVDTPGATLIAPGIWNGQLVKGIECKVVTSVISPPPSPPCKAFAGNGGCSTIESSIGDIQTQPGPFILRGFNILLALSGGVAVLLLMRAGYNIMMSRGNPEGLQRGREQFIAVIVGLLFLIFSFVLFQTIVVDILHIPGFSASGGGGGGGVPKFN